MKLGLIVLSMWVLLAALAGPAPKTTTTTAGMKSAVLLADGSDPMPFCRRLNCKP